MQRWKRNKHRDLNQVEIQQKKTQPAAQNTKKKKKVYILNSTTTSIQCIIYLT